MSSLITYETEQECTISKFVNGLKLRVSVYMSESRAADQGDLDRLETQGDLILLRLKENKHKS